MTEQQKHWLENRRRRLAGLPEVDRDGNEIVPKLAQSLPMSPAAAAKMGAEIAASYDPNSSEYRQYQGD